MGGSVVELNSLYATIKLLLIACLTGYVLLGLLLYLNQNNYIYYPTPAIDGHGFQAHLAGCPLCPAVHVTIRHALCRCPATLPLYQALAAVIQVPARTCEELFLFALFSHEQPMGSRTAFISFVGRALQAGVRSMLEAAVDMDEADADQADLDDHIEQLLAAAQHGHG